MDHFSRRRKKKKNVRCSLGHDEIGRAGIDLVLCLVVIIVVVVIVIVVVLVSNGITSLVSPLRTPRAPGKVGIHYHTQTSAEMVEYVVEKFLLRSASALVG